MKILLDTCVWGGVAQELRAAGHEVVWTGDWQEDPGDDEILERAHKEGRVLVTLDKDFGELAIVHSDRIRFIPLLGHGHSYKLPLEYHRKLRNLIQNRA